MYFHHSWPSGRRDPQRFAAQPYDISDHVFSAFAERAARMDTTLAARVTPELLDAVLDMVPDDWLEPEPGLATATGIRSAYRAHLLARLAAPRRWPPVRAVS